jgi:hypothetical protein
MAPRSEDWPNLSWRSLAIVYLSFSISSARCFASLSAALARASAASNASRVAMIIACALARSVGSESALGAMPHKNHKTIRL